MNVGLVPREPAAFEDFRRDLIMQGQGPETVVVINSLDLLRHVPTCTDPLERAQAQRLLRNLHQLLVMFQSRDALKWISAAESVRNWLLSDRGWHFFDDGSTHHGSDHAEEGEEESEGDDDDIDPQDRLFHAKRGDRDDGDGAHVSGT